MYGVFIFGATWLFGGEALLSDDGDIKVDGGGRRASLAPFALAFVLGFLAAF